MSGILEVFKQPKVVITADDGTQLWIDPLKSDGSPSYFSKYQVTAQFGDPPANNPQVMTCVPCFVVKEGFKWMISPGWLGIPWILWIAGGVYGALEIKKQLK